MHTLTKYVYIKMCKVIVLNMLQDEVITGRWNNVVVWSCSLEWLLGVTVWGGLAGILSGCVV